jgi:hypothetical protein
MKIAFLVMNRIRAGERIGGLEDTFIGHLARLDIHSQRFPQPSTTVS